MAAIKLAEGIYSVGVFNPNLRLFDIVMPTEYGTSYNAYLVKGEKTALIETVHLDFFDQYLANIKEVTTLEEIDYLIMNHNEPDHSGSVAKLMELIPNLKVVASQAGSLYLKNITNNKSLAVTVVKDGESIDLGGKTLSFINAPFLHWPDSMFTYVPENEALFSCDFLGSHYCETTMLDTSILPRYKAAYDSAMLGYYTAIFGPFKPYVLKGLEKLKDLSLAFVATSHGPVLTKEGFLPEVMEKYRVWSTPAVRETKQIPLFYCSAYGNTAQLAEAIASGIRETLPDAEVACYDLTEQNMGEMGALLNASDAFLVGSPTLNRDAVPPVWMLLAHIDAINIAKRPAALFGSYGWSGEACKNLRARLEGLKVNVYAEDFRVTFVPSEEELANAKAFGAAFAATLA